MPGAGARTVFLLRRPGEDGGSLARGGRAAFTVGDLGRLDDEGYLFLDGRREDLVISGGVNVYPVEVENAMREHLGIDDIAVFGVPDDEWGHRVCAAVVGTATESELAAFARERLSPAKRPKSWRFVDDLPRTSTGKVRRVDLGPGWAVDVHRRHALSFGTAAGAYAAHRPDYAPAAVRWALEPAPGPRVLDLGAGTGKLTGALVALGADVSAVEPDPAMRDELRRALPAVRVLPGSAEAIPLPDASVDAVLAGNALHWFDMALAGPEIARVLAPGGILAGLWNVVDDRVDWVAGLARVSGSAAIGARDTLSSWRVATALARSLGSGLRSRPSFRTGSVVPPSHWSRHWRRVQGCWSCRNQNERRRSGASAPSSRPDRRPPAASSPFRC